MKIIKTLGLLLSIMAFGAMANAVPITGSIDMSGTVVLNNMALGSTTAATGFSAVTVGGAPTGTYAALSGQTATWLPFTFVPATVPVLNLWTIAGGYSFDLTSLTVQTRTDTFLNILGQGVLHAPGFDNTTGAWSFTVSNPSGGPAANASFTFANSNVALPDGGSLLILLGVALVGLVGVARKFARK